MRSHHIHNLRVTNFRSLAAFDLSFGEINVFFGPNGAGKSSLLDALLFLRDCAVRGVDQAAAERDQGVGMLWDKAAPDARIEFEITTDIARYELYVKLAKGRIEPHAGERLWSADGPDYLYRRAGSATVDMMNPPGRPWVDPGTGRPLASKVFSLPQPERLSLEPYLTVHQDVPTVRSVDRALKAIKRFVCRDFAFRELKRLGSESGHEQWLRERGENAWSVLRNLKDRERVDTRWKTILGYMREAFPSFDDVIFEQTGPSSVYASFLEKGLRHPIFASGVPDGYLHLLLLLTAIFAEPEPSGSIVIFDEPDLSLHPWALAVFAKAVKEAAEKWGKQILLATHSPVLLSQFDPTMCFALARTERGTQATRVSEMEGIGPLLEQYALGSLFMAEAVAPQHTTHEE